MLLVFVPLLVASFVGFFPVLLGRQLVLFCVAVGLLGKNKAVGVLLSSLVQSSLLPSSG